MSDDSKAPQQATSPGQLPLWTRRIIRMTLAIAIGLILVVVASLLLFQRGMIYFPVRYPQNYRQLLATSVQEIRYKVGNDECAAFYVPAESVSSGTQPLWVAFHGNASSALDWLDMLPQCAFRSNAFLLVDYPGYGVNEGKPTREGIIAGGEKALEALATHLGRSTNELEENMNVLGLSIGCAAGLDFAVRHPVKKIVLLAPFTCLLDMARRSVGTPLCYLLYDRFDNTARLKELAERSTPPRIDMWHGTQDQIVPFQMGKSMADAHPDMIRFHAVKDGDHNNLLEVAEEAISAVFCGEPDVQP